ncbi:MAG: aspartate aminotransferase family protein [Deltaproteobacteria bacterium]|nr:aspartate aminotransferase family protein [Deltaproteobacteria bacterium]
MVSEQELAKLSYPEAPKMVTDSVPGPKTQKYLEESKKYESMARGGGTFPLVMDEGMGATIKDPDGNVYIDITAGVAVTAVGRRHPRVVKAIESQLGKLMHAIDFSNTRRTELALKVSSVMPEGLRDNCITYFTQGGSGAVETAIKFVRKITGRSQIVAFHGDYHGVWCGAVSLTTGDQYREGYGPFIPGVIHVPYPYCYRCCFGMEYPSCGVQCAKYVDYVLNTPYTAADDVGAVIFEPQQGEGGYVIPPPEYIPMLKEACEKHGALLIADEVQAGAGRSGKMWSIEYSGVVPDMITWGKGMGSDVPMAGLTMRRDLGEKIRESSQPNTFAANALSAAVCMTNIDILTEDDNALIRRAGELGEHIKGLLNEGAKDTRTIGDVRGRGLFIGIEMVKDKETKEPLDLDSIVQIIMGLLRRGMVMVPCGRFGNVFRFMPPLVLTKEHAEKACEILLDAVKEVEK